MFLAYLLVVSVVLCDKYFEYNAHVKKLLDGLHLRMNAVTRKINLIQKEAKAAGKRKKDHPFSIRHLHAIDRVIPSASSGSFSKYNWDKEFDLPKHHSKPIGSKLGGYPQLTTCTLTRKWNLWSN